MMRPVSPFLGSFFECSVQRRWLYVMYGWDGDAMPPLARVEMDSAQRNQKRDR